MSKKVLRGLRWVVLATCVSVPHTLPEPYQWAAAVAAVFIAACLDFAASAGA